MLGLGRVFFNGNINRPGTNGHLECDDWMIAYCRGGEVNKYNSRSMKHYYNWYAGVYSGLILTQRGVPAG